VADLRAEQDSGRQFREWTSALETLLVDRPTTTGSDGSLAILAWNLIPRAPGRRSSMGDPLTQTGAQYEHEGESMQLSLVLEGTGPRHSALVSRVDDTHGNLARAYQQLGSPPYPTTDQIAELKKRTQLEPPQSIPIRNQQISLAIPANGIALIEVDSVPARRRS
jgi:xylan 1,4-beta-xylosidase